MSVMNNPEPEEQKGPVPSVPNSLANVTPEQMAEFIRSVIKQDERSLLTAKLGKYEDIAAPVINSFNQCLAGLKDLINRTEMLLDNGDSIIFSGTVVLNPTMRDITQKEDVMWPNYARLYDRTYSGDIQSTATWYRQDLS